MQYGTTLLQADVAIFLIFISVFQFRAEMQNEPDPHPLCSYISSTGNCISVKWLCKVWFPLKKTTEGLLPHLAWSASAPPQQQWGAAEPPARSDVSYIHWGWDRPEGQKNQNNHNTISNRQYQPEQLTETWTGYKEELLALKASLFMVPTFVVAKISSLMWPPPNSFFNVALVAAYNILCRTWWKTRRWGFLVILETWSKRDQHLFFSQHHMAVCKEASKSGSCDVISLFLFLLLCH